MISELYVDLFCGMGGSSKGVLDAFRENGTRVEGHFVNHNEVAINTHALNHEGRHYAEDLFHLDPAAIFPVGTRAALLWASPACTFFSIARGAACVNEQDRSHALSINSWIDHLRPEVVFIENVKEFRDWGPVEQKRDADGRLMWSIGAKKVDAPARLPGESEEAWADRLIAAGYNRYEMPIKSRKGEYYKAWVDSICERGYDCEYRLLCSADYGDPTIRTRLIIQFARKDSGKKIVWPNPSHSKDGRDGLKKWVATREIIEWDDLGVSIFNRKKKLAKNTIRRLCIGLVKYGLSALLDGGTSHFIRPKNQGHDKQYMRSVEDPTSTSQTISADGLVTANIELVSCLRGQSNATTVDQPLRTVTTGQNHAVANVRVELVDHMRGTGVATNAEQPLRTVAASACHHALATAFLSVIDNIGKDGKNVKLMSLDEPTKTLPTKNNHTLAVVSIEEMEREMIVAAESAGVYADDAVQFLRTLLAELQRKGIHAKPWIYVYYSSGSEGAHIDSPIPTLRTKEGSALVYPVIEFDGKFLKIDLLYRMLKVIELQRSMGFPDDIQWGDTNKAERVKMIGNSVSCGLSKALALAWLRQCPEVAN